MNYIRELRAFHDAQQTRRVDANAKLLWHELMYICNTAGWPEWFDVWSSTLTEHTGLNSSALRRAREALVKHGYIAIKSHGTKATSFKILSQVRAYGETCEEQEPTQEPTQEVVQEAVQEANNFPKLNKIKLNNNILPPYNPPAEEKPKKKKTAKKAVRDVFAEYAGENLELLQALRDMEANRKALRKPYATDKARELACGELDKLAGNNAEKKIKIIEQSIMRGWQGLFELKDERPKAAEKPPEEKKEKTSRYDYAEIRRRDRERLKRLVEEEI